MSDANSPETTPSPIVELEFPQLTSKVSLDCTSIPAATRLDFLKGAVRSYIANRLNAAHNRHAKDETVAAWAAYDAATAADPLQTTVAKPTAERPADPDYAAVYSRAVADLQAGTIRKQSDTPKVRKTKDPLTSLVTDVVVRSLYDARRAADPKYTFFSAKKDVGTDGLAYLNTAIDAKVNAAAPADQAALRTQLEKVRDEKYVNPAKAMLGITSGKKIEGLPSIL